jgi:hypothetical protein
MSKSINQTLLLDGRHVHPLVYAAEKYSRVELGKLLGHANHSTVAIYIIRARKKPSTKVPVGWVQPLAKLLNVKPSEIRPDLFRPEWEMPA